MLLLSVGNTSSNEDDKLSGIDIFTKTMGVIEKNRQSQKNTFNEPYSENSKGKVFRYIADCRKLQRVLASLLDRITYYLYAQRLSLVGAYVVTF